MAAASAALSVRGVGLADRAASPPAFRAFCTIAVVIAFQVAGYGLYWDIQWHEFIGRDTFFIPPHLLLYLGVAVAGVASLLSILYESLVREEDDGSVAFLWIFRGARGMFLTGFGILFIVIAAPLDDNWHRLYGLDAALWTPFHLMGLFGSLVALVGLLYTLAGFANAERFTPYNHLGYNVYEWLIFLEFAALFSLSMLLAEPALRYGAHLGAGVFAFYPAMLMWSVPITLWTVSAVVYARSGGAALALMAVWFLRTAAFSLSVPLALQNMVMTLGLTYRNPDRLPYFTLLSVGLLASLAPGVLVIAWAGRRGTVSLSAGALASFFFALGAGAWMFGASPTLQALPFTLLLAAFGGAVATWAGRGFGKRLEAE